MPIRASDRHIIARRPVTGRDADHWRPMAGATMSVAAARDAYDAGLVEIAQGRDGDEMVLYAIPRRERIVRVAWFGRRTDIPPHKVTLRGVA